MEATMKAPVLGVVKDITESTDKIFSDKLMGDGIIVIPENGKILAPCSGKIDTVTASKHAITMVSDDGIELILHVGVDTVELKGKGFESFVKSGDIVCEGDQLLNVDIDLIKEENYSTETLLVVLSKDYGLTKLNLNKTINSYEEVLKCHKL